MNWKNIVKSIAPVIGGSLGGPFGSAAAKFAISKITGSEVPTGENPESFLETLITGADPEKLATLKNIDNDFKVEMKKLGIEEKQLHANDRDSARDLAIAKGMLPQILMSVIYTVAYGVVLYFFMAGQISVQENQQVLFGSLIGILTAAQIQILNFWFGSSSGSKLKTIHGK